MRPWKQSFKKLLWIPVLILLVSVGGFIFDAINTSLSWDLVRVYILNLFLYIVFTYIPLVVYFRYPQKSGLVILWLLFIAFAIGSGNNNPIGQNIREFINGVISVEFLVASITVGAFLITIHEIRDNNKSRRHLRRSRVISPNIRTWRKIKIK